MSKQIKINTIPPEEKLFQELSHLFEQSQKQFASKANSTVTMLFWHIGNLINENILQNKWVDYGKQIVVTLSRQLSSSHFLAIVPLKKIEAKLFYGQKASEGLLGLRDLRKEIASKTFERTAIDNLQINITTSHSYNNFEDPYFLDLKNTYLEKGLVEAILRELESFILELGKDFAFVELSEEDYEEHSAIL